MPRTDLSYLKNIILALVGIPVGVVTGLTGLSCAPVVQPLLTWLLGLTGTVLSGVVLASVSFSAWSGLLAFSQAGDVSWISGLFLLLGSFVGAALAAKAILRSPVFFVRVRSAWSFIPLALAFMMIVSITDSGARSTLNTLEFHHAGVFLPILWSLGLGVVSGFIGQCGELGGLLIVPLLLIFLGRTIWQAEGTALIVLVLASLPPLLVHALKRQISGPAAMALSVGGVLGALYGSHIAVNEIPAEELTVFCAAIIVVFSVVNIFHRPAVSSDNSVPPLDGAAPR